MAPGEKLLDEWLRFAHTLADAAHVLLAPAAAQRPEVRVKADRSFVALAWQGVPVLGVMHLPVTNQRYAGVAGRAGRTDLAIDAGLKLVDYAPFRPLIEGAGGVISDWQGRAITLASGSQVLAAGDAAHHDEALALIATTQS